jgi:hypothetical protein
LKRFSQHLYIGFCGAYPTEIETFDFNHAAGDAGKVVRAVTFKFNNMIILQNRQAAFDCHLLHLFSDISDIIESKEVKNAELAIAKKFNDERNAAREKIRQAYNATSE